MFIIQVVMNIDVIQGSLRIKVNERTALQLLGQCTYAHINVHNILTNRVRALKVLRDSLDSQDFWKSHLHS